MATPNQRISQYANQGRQQERSHQGHSPEATGIKKAYEQAEGLVRDNPGYSVMATFAMGLGLGLLVAAMCPSKQRRASRIQDYVGENARDAISSAVSRFVPDAVARFLSKHG
jgi:hypothetical protein